MFIDSAWRPEHASCLHSQQLHVCHHLSAEIHEIKQILVRKTDRRRQGWNRTSSYRIVLHRENKQQEEQLSRSSLMLKQKGSCSAPDRVSVWWRESKQIKQHISAHCSLLANLFFVVVLGDCTKKTCALFLPSKNTCMIIVINVAGVQVRREASIIFHPEVVAKQLLSTKSLFSVPWRCGAEIDGGGGV